MKSSRFWKKNLTNELSDNIFNILMESYKLDVLIEMTGGFSKY